MDNDPTTIGRLRETETRLNVGGMRYEAEVCHNAANELEKIRDACNEIVAEPINNSAYQSGKWMVAAQVLRVIGDKE